MTDDLAELKQKLASCRLCQTRFAQTETAHEPRPIVWFDALAPILLAGQAPGARVHTSGMPFDDPSGDRLREWLGITRETFYAQDKISILPMAFCFPGYDARGSDLPPPVICRKTWHTEILEHLSPKLTLLVGGYAQKFHLGAANAKSVTETVRNWRVHAPRVFPLPHPSWRNTGWIKKNLWFEAELIPSLRARVQEVLNND